MVQERGAAEAEYEKIDFTQWIADRTSIVTEERASKGDMLIERAPPTKSQQERGEPGHIRYAQVQVRNILRHLSEREVLDEQHIHDGQTYEIWQTIFRARTGYRNNPIYADELVRMRGAIAQDGLDVSDYVILIRRLGVQKCRIIEDAIYSPVTPQVRQLLSGGADDYVRAFDSLSWIMRQLREEWKHRKESETNSCNNDRFLT